uniref:Neutral sphingomyelinase, putative n=1 Tax=Theileria annulata TaxID=5874 RepID=A0A3B0MRH4_THEAN
MLSTVRSFDLVLLEEGEEYVTDAACTLFTSFPNQSTFNTNSTHNNSIISSNTGSSNRNNVENVYNKGRIRIGTKSLIFEPDSLDMPLLKLQFQHITHIQHHNNSCNSNNVNSMNNGVNVDENGILVCSKQVTSIPTSIYNGKSRFITPYTTYTINNSTNNITNLGNIRDAGLGRLELENISCYTFLFIYSTAEIQKQQFIIFNSLLNSIQNSIPVPNTIPYGTGVIGVSMGIIPNREKLILGVGKESVYCWRLKRMVRHGGFCALTDRALYFQPSPNFSRKLFKRINLDSVLHIFKRDSGLTSTGECLTALEVVSLPEEITDKIKRKQYRCIYLEFKQGSDRDKLVNALKDIVPKAFFAIDSRGFRNEMIELWRMGLLPNFQYLDFLNCIAGRSRYDISHYPVFPWVLTDYSSPTLDLNNQNVYRDLSKPIGSLNIERLHLIKKRMYNLFLSNSVNNMDKGSDGNLKNRDTSGKNVNGSKSVKSGDEDLWDMGYYIYGSHYSTPALIVFFLIRLLPECQLRLYGGRFDSSSRTFNNIQHTYENVMNGHSSFFELIPEFYESDELFLKNSLNITTQDGRLGDVELPKWAHNSPTQFLKIMRSALESDYVSKNLTNWIDLIFGYKQSGQNSIVNNNTYHPLTYLGSVHAGKLRTTSAIQNLLKTMDSHAISVQVREFGQSPILLFDTPHPRKYVFLGKKSFYRLLGHSFTIYIRYIYI